MGHHNGVKYFVGAFFVRRHGNGGPAPCSRDFHIKYRCLIQFAYSDSIQSTRDKNGPPLIASHRHE